MVVVAASGEYRGCGGLSVLLETDAAPPAQKRAPVARAIPRARRGRRRCRAGNLARRASQAADLDRNCSGRALALHDRTAQDDRCPATARPEGRNSGRGFCRHFGGRARRPELGDSQCGSPFGFPARRTTQGCLQGSGRRPIDCPNRCRSRYDARSRSGRAPPRAGPACRQAFTGRVTTVLLP